MRFFGAVAFAGRHESCETPQPERVMSKKATACVFLALGMQAASAAGPVTTLAFNPDGSELLSNGTGRIIARSPTNATPQREIACDLRRISQFAFHPGGRRLAVAGGIPGASGEVQVLDWPGGSCRQRFTNFTDVVTSTAFSPRGDWLAGGSMDHSVLVWRWTDGTSSTGGKETHRLIGHAGPVLAVAFGPGGSTLMTASADRSIKIWSTADGRLLRSLSQHTEAVHALVFRPRGDPTAPVPAPDFAASAGEDRTVRVWQPEIGRLVRIVRSHRGPVYTLAYAADGSALFSAGQEGVIRRLDADSDKILAEWTAHADWIYSLAVSRDGHWLASGDWTGQVRVWDLRQPARNSQPPP